MIRTLVHQCKTRHPQADKRKSTEMLCAESAHAHFACLFDRYPTSNWMRRDSSIPWFLLCGVVHTHIVAQDFYIIQIYHLINFMSSFFLAHFIIVLKFILFWCFFCIKVLARVCGFIKNTQNISNLMFCVVCHFLESVVFNFHFANTIKKQHTHRTQQRLYDS